MCKDQIVLTRRGERLLTVAAVIGAVFTLAVIALVVSAWWGVI